MICKRALLIAAAAAGCDAYEPGIEVAITTSAAIGEGPLHGLVTFREGEGGVEISHLHLAVASIELIECESPIASFFSSLLIGTAYAHSETTPFVLGVPHVIDAARTSTMERTIGTLRPPPGTYCALRLSFGPADADAVGLDPDARSSAVGRTMIMQGLDWLEGQQPKPLALETDQRIEVRVDLAGPDGSPQELELSADRKNATISYGLSPSMAIHGLREAADDHARAQIVLRNLVESARATIR